mmetsp:Transcript_8437/g.14134  ORF Transcript_8437/g.14134 Transcript_8437/m.14134 type:complete len:527 (+) Transcript_8437:187-1767(+)
MVPNLSILIIVVAVLAVNVVLTIGQEYSSDSSFSVNVSNIRIVGHLGQENHDAFLLQDMIDKQKQYVMKLPSRYTREEIIADTFYAALGINIPSFIIVRQYDKMPKQFRNLVERYEFVRISEYISGSNLEEQSLKRRNRGYFVMHALMANGASMRSHDVRKADHAVYQIYSSPLVRNHLEEHKKDEYLLPELVSWAKRYPDVYGKLQREQLYTQIRFVFSRAEGFQRKFAKIATALNMPERRADDVWRIFRHRLELLEMIANPGVSYPARSDRQLSVASAAGALIIAYSKRGVPYVLLGSRRSKRTEQDGKWCSLGGKVELHKDTNFSTAVAREVFEETTGKVDLPLSAIESARFHDIVYEDKMFRNYIVFLSEMVDTRMMRPTERSARPAALRDNEATAAEEYHELRWFPLEAVLAVNRFGKFTAQTAVGKGTSSSQQLEQEQEPEQVGKQQYVVFSRFREWLHIEHVQSIIRGITMTKGKPSSFAGSITINGTTTSAAATTTGTQSFKRRGKAKTELSDFHFAA